MWNRTDEKLLYLGNLYYGWHYLINAKWKIHDPRYCYWMSFPTLMIELIKYVIIFQINKINILLSVNIPQGKPFVKLFIALWMKKIVIFFLSYSWCKGTVFYDHYYIRRHLSYTEFNSASHRSFLRYLGYYSSRYYILESLNNIPADKLTENWKTIFNTMLQLNANLKIKYNSWILFAL